MEQEWSHGSIIKEQSHLLSFRSRYQKLKFFYELKKEAEEKSTNQFLVKARFSDSVEPEFAQLAKDFFLKKNKVSKVGLVNLQ